jgi:hypothetical protein
VTPPTWLYFPATAAAPWVPSDVSGLLAWYKADSISQSDDTNVTSWTNSQGTSGRDLVDAGTAPKFRTNVQNSLPVVRFGGSGNLEVVNTSGFIPSTQSPITVAGVVKVANTTTDHMFVSAAASTNTNNPRIDFVRRLQGASSGWRTLWAGTSTRFADGPTSSTGYRIALTSVNSSMVPTHRIDGAAGSLTFGGAYSDYTGNGTASPTGLYVGCTRADGGRVERLPSGAEIGEIVMYDSALSTADAERLEGYLAHKWGLTGDLPGGHPHKTTPP